MKDVNQTIKFKWSLEVGVGFKRIHVLNGHLIQILILFLHTREINCHSRQQYLLHCFNGETKLVVSFCFFLHLFQRRYGMETVQVTLLRTTLASSP